MLEGAITTIRDRADDWREPGGPSRYCLQGACQQTAHYHAIHIWQFRYLARMTGDPYFDRIAARYERDDMPARPGHGIPGGR